MQSVRTFSKCVDQALHSQSLGRATK